MTVEKPLEEINREEGYGTPDFLDVSGGGFPQEDNRHAWMTPETGEYLKKHLDHLERAGT